MNIAMETLRFEEIRLHRYYVCVLECILVFARPNPRVNVAEQH